jgi:molecular chaperone GrpE
MEPDAMTTDPRSAADLPPVAEPAGAEPAAQAAADPLAVLEAEKAQLAQAAAEARDRALRALAEMENMRRRTEKEVADAKSYGIAAFARDMLTVGDNLRRALDAVPADLKASAESGAKAFLDGLDLTERELLKALEKHGVRKLEPQGQKFDPNLHQAMFEVPDPSVPNGTVVNVVQAGYVIGERVLRPALVGIAKGGPKTAPATETPAEG